MTVSDYLQKKSPKKRKANKLQEAGCSKCLFVPNLDYLSEKARSVQYWRGGKQRAKEAPQSPSPFELATGFAKGRPGPERRLRLEQEFLLTQNET